jgi:hypothetical protein
MKMHYRSAGFGISPFVPRPTAVKNVDNFGALPTEGNYARHHAWQESPSGYRFVVSGHRGRVLSPLTPSHSGVHNP